MLKESISVLVYAHLFLYAEDGLYADKNSKIFMDLNACEIGFLRLGDTMLR